MLLAAGGSLTNDHGLIRGGYGGGVHSTHGYGGRGGAGVVLQAGGAQANSNSIYGGLGDTGAYFHGYGGDGAYLADGGTVTNTGVIDGALAQDPNNHADVGSGIFLQAGGRVVNGAPGVSTALIAGNAGVYAAHGAGATVINFGTISGQDSGSYPAVAVKFGAASDRLVVEAGSVLINGAIGGGGTLELASGKGTISGLGAVGTISAAAAMTFGGFGAYAIDKGSSWTLVGTNTLAAGQNLSVAGTLSGSGTLAVNGGTIVGLAPERRPGRARNFLGAAMVTEAASLAYSGHWIQSAGTLNVPGGQTATFTGGADRLRRNPGQGRVVAIAAEGAEHA